jgi:hypothetical protein
VFCIKQQIPLGFKWFGLSSLLPPPLGAISYGLLASIVFFVVVSLLTSNASIAHMQREYDEILGETAPAPAD